VSGRRVQGIVFDFDGVIVASMANHAEAYRQVLAPFGVTVADKEVLAREGARSETIIRDLLRQADQHPADHDIARLAGDKQRAFQALGRPTLYPGAADSVRQARDAFSCTGLVTGTRRTNLEALVPELLPLFTTILAQGDYTHDKPHPEPYARAAVALDTDPADLVAVENAVRGVQSARSAGYGTVIGIATTMPTADLQAAGAHVVVRDHQDLQDRLRSLAS
jgi:beta-phosphoglucomutase